MPSWAPTYELDPQDGLKEIVFIEGFGNIMVWDVPGTPAPEAMQWPMFRHDPGHTAALAANP